MAKKNVLDVILKTINDVQQKNSQNPREETAHQNVFDLVKNKIGEIDQKMQDKRASKGKKPISILDLIKNQVEAAKKYNKKDPNTPTAPDAVFDRIVKKVEDRPRRVASAGLRRIVEEYNLDVSRLPRNTVLQIQQKYDNDLRKVNHQYAQAIHDLIQRT